MDFSLSPEQLELKRDARRFAHEELNPTRRGAASEPEFDRSLWTKCAEFGVQGSFVGTEHGGRGRDVITTILLMEAVGYGCRDNGFTLPLGRAREFRGRPIASTWQPPSPCLAGRWPAPRHELAARSRHASRFD